AGGRVRDIAATHDASLDLRLIGQTLSAYDGAAFVGLPIGQIGAFGALVRVEHLAYSDEQLQDAYGMARPPYLQPVVPGTWTAEYPVEFGSQLAPGAGYAFRAGSASHEQPAGYFIQALRLRYDFHSSPGGTPRGLVVERADPLHDNAVDPSGHRTLITYDDYQ